MRGKFLKRVATLFLSVIMCLTMLPLNCLAVTTSYTPSDSYKSGKYYQNLLSVKLTGNQAKDLVAVAMSQVGYHEGTSKKDMDGVSSGGGKYTEYGYMHGDASAQWCAYFVSWCARQARIPTSLIPKSGGAGDAKKASGTYYDVSSGYIPKAGDLIFYEPSKGVASRNTATGIPKGTSHVNICYKDGTDGKIHMIGGNEEGKVRKSDYPLPKKVGNWQNIQGYYHPNYSSDTTTDNSGNTIDSIINSMGTHIGVTAGNASDITSSNVTLSGSCTKPSASVKLNTCGVYIGTSTSNMTKKITQNVSEASNNMNSGTGFTMTYNASTHLGMTLSANTKYYYQFFVTYGNSELKSEVKSFTTQNAYKIIDQKAVLIIPKGKSANAYNTVTGNKVIGTYGSADAQRLLIPERYADLADGTRRFEMVSTDGTSYWIPYDSSFMTMHFLPTSIEPKETHIYLRAEEGETYYPEFNQYPANSYDTIEFSYSENTDVAYAYQSQDGVIEIVANGVGTTDLYFKAYRTKLTTKITVTVVDGGPPMFGDISIEKSDAGTYTVRANATDTNMARLGVAVWHKDDSDMKASPEVTWYDAKNGSLMTENFTYVNQSGEYIVTYTFDRDDLGPFSGNYIAAIYAEDTEGGLSRAQVGFTEDASYDETAFPFDDVSGNDWFCEGVYYNYLKGTMTGLKDTKFGPYDYLARAQFASMLYRMEGTPAVETEKSFKDISGDEWYAPAVLWAAENNITSGYANGNWGPGDKITREQMAIMLYRYTNARELDTSERTDFSKFTDASEANDYAAEAIEWAVGSGIITGKDNGKRLDPQGNTTRAEAASILQRYMS